MGEIKGGGLLLLFFAFVVVGLLAYLSKQPEPQPQLQQPQQELQKQKGGKAPAYKTYKINS